MIEVRAVRRAKASTALAVVIAIAFAVAPVAAKSETFLNPLGGPGGSPFSRQCPPGEALHGFELRAADDVDAIRPICFRTGGPGESISPGMYAGEWHGGPGGRIGRVNCPANQGISAVAGMSVASEGRTEVVNEIHLFCASVSTDTFQPSTPASIFKGPRYQGNVSPDRLTYNQQSQQCPDGEIAVGVHGRTGVWVDAIGLICATPPVDRGFADLKRRPPPVALGRVQPKPPPMPLGRKQPTSAAANPLERNKIPLSVILAPPPICNSAQSARARNSPAAPGLERQCQVAMEQAATAARAAPPPVIAAPVPLPPPIIAAPAPLPAPVGNPPYPGPWQPYSVCDAAREARYNNSPDAYALESQCRAQGGGYPGPVANAPGSSGPWQPSPICDAARRARYNNSPAAERLEALCRAGSDVWGQPGTRRPLSFGERSEVLDVHNQQRPDYLRLQWDVALEDSAARWAAQMAAYGQMMPDNTLRGALGENLFMAVPSGRYRFGDITRIWASERSSFRPGIFPDVTGYGSSAQVNNYTQMIWPDTTHVGCAVERTPRADFFVCRYSPAGNINGRPVR